MDHEAAASTCTATKWAKRNRCSLVMKNESNGFEASSISEIEIVNVNFYRSLGFDITRVRNETLRRRLHRRTRLVTLVAFGITISLQTAGLNVPSQARDALNLLSDQA